MFRVGDRVKVTFPLCIREGVIENVPGRTIEVSGEKTLLSGVYKVRYHVDGFSYSVIVGPEKLSPA